MIDTCTANVDDVANIHRVQIARVHDVIINYCLSVNYATPPLFDGFPLSLQRINEINIENARLLIIYILLVMSKTCYCIFHKILFFLSFIVLTWHFVYVVLN